MILVAGVGEVDVTYMISRKTCSNCVLCFACWLFEPRSRSYSDVLEWAAFGRTHVDIFWEEVIWPYLTILIQFISDIYVN